MKRALIMAAALFALTACGPADAPTSTATTVAGPDGSDANGAPPLAYAHEACIFGTLNGNTLTFSTDGALNADQGRNVDQMNCVLNALLMPPDAVERVYSTQPEDGQQTAEWLTFTAMWTFNEADGISMSIVQAAR